MAKGYLLVHEMQTTTYGHMDMCVRFKLKYKCNNSEAIKSKKQIPPHVSSAPCSFNKLIYSQFKKKSITPSLNLT